MGQGHYSHWEPSFASFLASVTLSSVVSFPRSGILIALVTDRDKSRVWSLAGRSPDPVKPAPTLQTPKIPNDLLRDRGHQGASLNGCFRFWCACDRPDELHQAKIGRKNQIHVAGIIYIRESTPAEFQPMPGLLGPGVF